MPCVTLNHDTLAIIWLHSYMSINSKASFLEGGSGDDVGDQVREEQKIISH